MRKTPDEGMNDCPRCGGREIALRETVPCDGTSRRWVYGKCYPCRLTGPVAAEVGVTPETEDEATRLWNAGPHVDEEQTTDEIFRLARLG